ncbi:MAG: helix-turn-helix domain-containing protein [Erysipelotrichaceae bacterium]|nr:helix-turn-helix domain-containing protein [Erysipelotrichaceae bacterium]
MHLHFCFKGFPTEQTPAAMLKYYWQRKGLTTRQLAESIGVVVPSTVLMYERGHFPIPYQTAVAMAEVIEIDRSLLFDEFAQFMDYPYSDRLREVRKAHKLNQATFAEKAGISLSIYSKWESGSRQPSRKMYRQLVNTYPEINIRKHSVSVI